MIFDLTIYRNTDDGEDVAVATHPRVDVQWVEYDDDRSLCGVAVARRDGAEVARLHTFDDYPINIEEDFIRTTSGYVNGAEGYFHWVMRFAK